MEEQVNNQTDFEQMDSEYLAFIFEVVIISGR